MQQPGASSPRMRLLRQPAASPATPKPGLWRHGLELELLQSTPSDNLELHVRPPYQIVHRLEQAELKAMTGRRDMSWRMTTPHADLSNAFI
ncbi:Os03g0421150 [Oryza sativa Japonica Group]|uniref:Os03g0421150 protein n=1 Tax=Oryza sativa subsp. japonica TaxID=39947 RepID=A0A0P0VZK4_ORYSJ|nr:Os03g0421150 [Oryza sativa Japonica Group]